MIYIGLGNVALSSPCNKIKGCRFHSLFMCYYYGQLASRNGFEYLETSAVTGKNVQLVSEYPCLQGQTNSLILPLSHFISWLNHSSSAEEYFYLEKR